MATYRELLLNMAVTVLMNLLKQDWSTNNENRKIIAVFGKSSF